MTTPDIELILDGWLGEGTDVLPDRSVDAILRIVEHTPQRRAIRAPWRFPTMNGSSRFAMLAGAAVIVVLFAGGLLWLGGRSPATGGPSPSSAATPDPSTTSAAIDSPAPSSALGLRIGPGLQAHGTIVFGLHDAASDSDRLYEIAPDGTGERLLSEGDACCLTLPSDGRAALVAEDVDGRMVPAVLKLSGDSFEESAWSDFAPGLNLVPGAWAKTADLAFDGWAESDPSKTGIYLSIANGGGGLIGDLVRLTSNPGAQHDIPIAFSPDGSKLLFIRETPNADRTGNLYVIGIGGYLPDKVGGRKHYQPGDLRRLNPANVGVAVSDLFGPGASWSPDGTRVAFSGFDATSRPGEPYGATSRAYIVDVAGGDATAITEDSTNMTSAHWSPNGEWIAYDFDHPGGEGARDVWLVRPDGSDAHQLTVTDGSCCAAWSPWSSKLLFQGIDVGGPGLFIAYTDGSGYSRLLTVDSEYDLRWYSWRP